MMTRDEAIEIIKRGLGFLNSTIHDTAIVEALKRAQAIREGGLSLPWFLLREDETVAITPSQQSYALPTGFLKEDIDFNPVSITDAQGNVYYIDPIGYEEAVRLYAGATEGGPEVYSLRGSTINVFPLPDTTYTLTWSYYKTDDKLDTNIENLWLLHAPYVLVADAGLKMATDLRDLEGTSIYRSEKAQWDDWFTRRMTEQRESNTRYVVGKYA
jgi:hypothetical protein